MPKKTFSCIKCGKPFDAYPPDDLHQDASRNLKDLYEEDTIKIDYECSNAKCATVNTLYWGSAKVGVAIL